MANDNRPTEAQVLRYNQRRARLGLSPTICSAETFCSASSDGLCDDSTFDLNSSLRPLTVLSFKDVFSSVGRDRAKAYLAMRRIEDPDLLRRLDKRRPARLQRTFEQRQAECGHETLLTVSPSLRFAGTINSFLGSSVVLSTNQYGSGRFSPNVQKSRSIRFDPMEAYTELYKYRIRIQRAIAYAYSNDFTPIMVTFTIPSRWGDFLSQRRLLDKCRTNMFTGRAGQRLKDELGIVHYINRWEETINTGDDDSLGNGLHNHIHTLFLIRNNGNSHRALENVSQLEDTLKRRWQSLVDRYYVEIFHEEYPISLQCGLYRHGLVVSRYAYGPLQGRVRAVQSSDYFAKVFGVEPFEGDSELTTVKDNNRSPFNLLRQVTAQNVDLWCEYYIAYKGAPSVRFSHGLEDEIKTFFEQNPHLLDKSEQRRTPVAILDSDTFNWFRRHNLLSTLQLQACLGFDKLYNWVKDRFGFLLHRPPDISTVGT